MNNQPQNNLALGQNPTVASSGIEMGALLDEWRLSKSYVELYTRDFRYLDDLVDGVNINADKDAPFVGDTTLAGLVRSIPRNSLQQLPVFSMIVNGTKLSVPALLCTFFLKRYVFNEDTFGKGLLSTLQIGAEQSLTHGYAPFFVATGMMFNDFGTTMRLLHYMDTSPEPGITDANESGYHYVAANLTPSRVKKIRRAARNNPNTTWDPAALDLVLESQPRAKSYSIYESVAKRNQPGEEAGPTYEFVTRYPVGSPDEPIITFCPEVTTQPLRTMTNRSKFNYPRVVYLVIDPAALTPFGTSRVRLASPNQNMMNIYYGQIAAMLLLNSKPPILKRGRFTKPVQLKRGAVWETLDQNAAADLKNMDNGALEQFSSFAQVLSGQIMNIMGGQTNSAPASEKFSKTAPGVKQSQDFLDVNTNQITKILENFLRQYALLAIDTLLSEQEGEDDIIIDDETKNQLNELSPGFVGDDNKVHINWQRFYQAIEDWSVEITVSVSKDEMQDEKRQDLQDTLTVLAQMAPVLGPDAVQKVKELTDMLVQDNVPMAAKIEGHTPPAMQPAQPIPAMPGPAPQ